MRELLLAICLGVTSAAPAQNSGHSTPVQVDAATAPTVALSASPDAVGGWNVHLETERFRFAPEHVNGENVLGEGHAHLYVDDKKIARMYGPWFHIVKLRPGTHTIRVSLHTNNHANYVIGDEPIAAGIELAVEKVAKATAAHDDARVFLLDVRGGNVRGVSARTVKVKEGEVVELHWTSDSAIELHLHDYDMRAGLVPGTPSAMRFHAKTAGRFPVESHGDAPKTILYVEVHPK